MTAVWIATRRSRARGAIAAFGGGIARRRAVATFGIRGIAGGLAAGVDGIVYGAGARVVGIVGIGRRGQRHAVRREAANHGSFLAGDVLEHQRDLAAALFGRAQQRDLASDDIRAI